LILCRKTLDFFAVDVFLRNYRFSTQDIHRIFTVFFAGGEFPVNSGEHFLIYSAAHTGIFRRMKFFILPVCALLLLTGCATYKTITVKAHDAFAPVPVSDVKIVSYIPAGAVFMGDIQGKASSTDDESVNTLQEKIRAEAAKIGANRVFFGQWHTHSPSDFQTEFFISAKAYFEN